MNSCSNLKLESRGESRGERLRVVVPGRGVLIQVRRVQPQNPPVTTVGSDGDPTVRTWQEGGGVALLAHTLLVVNPVDAGKPKV